MRAMPGEDTPRSGCHEGHALKVPLWGPLREGQAVQGFALRSGDAVRGAPPCCGAGTGAHGPGPPPAPPAPHGQRGGTDSQNPERAAGPAPLQRGSVTYCAPLGIGEREESSGRPGTTAPSEHRGAGGGTGACQQCRDRAAGVPFGTEIPQGWDWEAGGERARGGPKTLAMWRLFLFYPSFASEAEGGGP